MHTKNHFEVGDKVKLEVFDSLELGDCSVSAELNGVDAETVLVVESINVYHGDQYLTFAEPYRKFGSMSALRFVKVG